MLIICNWCFEGLFDGCSWKVLKKYENDCGFKEFFLYYIVIWLVDGDFGVFWYFRIF